MNHDEFLIKYSETVTRAFKFSEKARREGLLALEDALDEDKVSNRDIFEYGMRFVVDGTDGIVIRSILENITRQENDKYKKEIMSIQVEAVLSIQAGDNPRILFYKLNSFTDLSLTDDPGAKALDEVISNIEKAYATRHHV